MIRSFIFAAISMVCFMGICLAQSPQAQSDLEAAAKREGKLVIYSSTDVAAASPLIKDFRALYPDIRVEYVDMNSTEVYNRFRAESAQGRRTADVMWSLAMDLQMKLVNDGYAQTYASPEAAGLPAWAVWRNEAFGTTFEPVVFVYNKRLLAEEEIPRAHADLARLLRENVERFRGRITTYDIEKAGVGFLLATQDSKTTAAFWDIACAVLGANPHMPSATSVMLERIASGEILIGYNLLGAYAIARARTDPSIGYVLPRDYTLVMSRIIFITKAAGNPSAARLWVDYILSRRGQQIIADDAQLFSIRPDVEGEATAAGLVRTLGDSIKPIAVGPGLLAHLDQSKRLEFTRRWQSVAKGGCRRALP
jgi:iron(III) transport system substrate-binding protein